MWKITILVLHKLFVTTIITVVNEELMVVRNKGKKQGTLGSINVTNCY